MIPFLFSDIATMPVPRFEDLAVHYSMATDCVVSYAGAPFPPRVPVESLENVWKAAVAKNFAAISALEDGWDGYGSTRINRATIYRADRLLMDAMQSASRVRAPYVVPSADGALQMEWRTAQHELEFRLGEDGSRSFWLHNRNTGAEIEGEGDTATELLFRWAKQVAAIEMDEVAVSAPTEAAPVLIAA